MQGHGQHRVALQGTKRWVINALASPAPGRTSLSRDLQSPCHQHSSESLTKHLQTCPTACVQSHAQAANCSCRSNSSDLDLVFPA